MLLFSTLLDINETLTKDAFIQLAIDWNQSSPHADNVIPNIEWDGSHNVRFGNDEVWLEINEYRNQNIIAIRYEKSTGGVVWDTDYVMNYNDMRMSIQLDRSYREDALNIDAEFSTPHFIRLLINGGYLKEDSGMPVLGTPIYVTETSMYQIVNVINGKSKYKLPVVYVSKLYCNQVPIDVNKLSGRLKGVAHVLVQSDNFTNKQLKVFCEGKSEYNGAIGVYFPNESAHSQRFFYHCDEGFDEYQMQKVIRSVIQYCNTQQLPKLYTWYGVNNALLKDRLDCKRVESLAAEKAQKDAEIEVEDVYEALDGEIKEYQNQIESLRNTIEALRAENYGLRTKMASFDALPLLFYGGEKELYAGEIKEMIISAIEDTLNTKIHVNTRRADVLSDIVKSNFCNRVVSEKREQIKTLLKSYNGLNGTTKQALMDFGFDISDDGKHYKLIFCGDNRYSTALSKTPSDYREGKNAASEIVGGML